MGSGVLHTMAHCAGGVGCSDMSRTITVTCFPDQEDGSAPEEGTSPMVIDDVQQLRPARVPTKVIDQGLRDNVFSATAHATRDAVAASTRPTYHHAAGESGAALRATYAQALTSDREGLQSSGRATYIPGRSGAASPPALATAVAVPHSQPVAACGEPEDQPARPAYVERPKTPPTQQALRQQGHNHGMLLAIPANMCAG